MLLDLISQQTNFVQQIKLKLVFLIVVSYNMSLQSMSMFIIKMSFSILVFRPVH